MARASSRTITLEVRSRSTGKESIVTERSWDRSRNVNGRVVRTLLRTEFKDANGRLVERLSANLLRCPTSGEELEVLGIAPSIRSSAKSR